MKYINKEHNYIVEAKLDEKTNTYQVESDYGSFQMNKEGFDKDFKPLSEV